jgi:hypothetical protein
MKQAPAKPCSVKIRILVLLLHDLHYIQYNAQKLIYTSLGRQEHWKDLLSGLKMNSVGENGSWPLSIGLFCFMLRCALCCGLSPSECRLRHKQVFLALV